MRWSSVIAIALSGFALSFCGGTCTTMVLLAEPPQPPEPAIPIGIGEIVEPEEPEPVPPANLDPGTVKVGDGVLKVDPHALGRAALAAQHGVPVVLSEVDDSGAMDLLSKATQFGPFCGAGSVKVFEASDMKVVQLVATQGLVHTCTVTASVVKVSRGVVTLQGRYEMTGWVDGEQKICKGEGRMDFYWKKFTHDGFSWITPCASVTPTPLAPMFDIAPPQEWLDGHSLWLLGQ